MAYRRQEQLENRIAAANRLARYAALLAEIEPDPERLRLLLEMVRLAERLRDELIDEMYQEYGDGS